MNYMNRKVIKKNILGIMSYAVLEGLFLKAISHIDFDSLEFIDVFNIVGAFVVLILALKAIFFPYIIVESGSISIHRDYFSRDHLRIEDIIKIDIKDGGFSKSNFVLKDNKKIRFDSFAISRKNLDYLRSYVMSALMRKQESRE